jgi:hypothetical protein
MSERKGGPSGVPIGRAFAIPSGFVHDDLRHAVDEVGRIHGDGLLPTIPLRLAGLRKSSTGERVRRGQLLIDPETNLPLAVLVEVNEAHRSFAALHEIGHLLDLVGIGEVGHFASMDDPMMDEWRETIVNSVAIGRLIQMIDDVHGGADRDHVADLLDPVETWARSYAQYIVRHCQSPNLRVSLDAFRTPNPAKLYYPQQWEETDFDPIDEVIERLFRRLGWRTGLLP